MARPFDAQKLTEHEQESVRLLRIIREHPGLDAISLQIHGLAPRDAGCLGDLKTRGRVDFKSGGWFLTSQGDLFLLQRWEGPVSDPEAPLRKRIAELETKGVQTLDIDPDFRPTIRTERPVGFVKTLAAGVLDFRSAGLPMMDDDLLKLGWRPVFWGADDV